MWSGRSCSTAAHRSTPDYFPFASGAYASEAVARVLEPLGADANAVIEHVGVVLAIVVVLVFLVFVVHSKHLHIGAAVANVAFARRPRALGAVLPVYSGGAEVDFEDPGEDDLMGRGKVEDFTWKGLLDFAPCTECGRCQSQCPAWNTGKPLSPKLLVMALRDHALAKAPYLLAADDAARAALPQALRAEGERPLVGTVAENGVIDPDVLWSCTTCGACVEQCPVDIEHVDHIVDLRRHQMLVESAFPEEAGIMLRNLEHSGDPWGRGSGQRLEWAQPLPFEVRVVGDERPGQPPGRRRVPVLGRLRRRARRHRAAHDPRGRRAAPRGRGVVHGPRRGRDLHRRLGPPDGQRVPLPDARQAERRDPRTPPAPDGSSSRARTASTPSPTSTPRSAATTRSSTTPSCSTHLVAAGRLVPVTPVEVTLTYHDACYLGRHNRIFTPPRELLAAVPGVRLAEMPRTRERSFCCGAGGARMWMDETLGTRISHNRAD